VNPLPVTTVEAVDPVFYFIFGICIVMLIGIAAVMLWFVIRYNRKRCPVPESQEDHNLWLEITWTIIPTFIVLLMFWYGWEGYLSLRRIPENAMPVQVNARMWSWLFTYENGKKSDKLYVPVGRPVKVKLIADDVLHSFYVPAFRVKRDCVPGMETYAWFVAEKAGSYNLFCAEYCGLAHSEMITTVEALPEEEFARWLEPPKPPEESDKPHPAITLLEEHRCVGCHSLDGSKKVGPTLKDIAGRETVVIVGDEEKTIQADREYIIRSILHPKEEVVKGFKPVMRSYEGKIDEADLQAIVDFLIGDESETEAPALDGNKLLEEKGCLRCHSTDGSKRLGPSFKGIFGREVTVTVTKDGAEQTLTSDRGYLRRAIADPRSEVVVGYRPIMRDFGLTEAEIEAVIDALEKMGGKP